MNVSTNNKNMQEIDELKKSEERYRLISSVSTDYTFSTKVMPDGSLDLNWVAGAFESISGYKIDEFKASGGWRASVHPDDLWIDDKDLEDLSHKKETHSQIRTINRNGEVVWVQVFSHPVWDETRNCLSGIYGAVRNITEQKLAEEALKASENQLLAIFNAISDILFLISVEANDEFRFISVNEVFYKLTGLKKEKVIDKSIKEVIPEQTHKLVLDKFRKAISTGQTILWEETMDFPSGKKYGLVKLTPIYDTAGSCTNLVGTMHDITLLREKEKEILDLNSILEQRVIERTKELQSANKELEAFSYSVSHDLRAPLRAIHGFVEILMDEYAGKLDDEGKKICKLVEDNALRMGQLIDDLLSFSRLVRSEFRFTTVDMEPIVKQIVSELTVGISGKKVDITTGKLYPSVCDPSMIRQVWINLVSNAIKYSSPKNEIQLEIGSEKLDDEIQYFIRDNGIGFDMKYSHKLFGVFQRLHNIKEIDGTGVGLAIVERIISRHHGRVWADSVIGEGSTFYFTLPIRQKTKL